MGDSVAVRFGKRIVDYPENVPQLISSKTWVKDLGRNPIQLVKEYFISLFPIAGWITRYNLGWLLSDVIAGLTVGMVLVPQGMSYAQIATLRPEYGLYSSFVGVLIYCFFATSKDVSIGPVAVMSLTVSQIITYVDVHYPKQWSAPEIATTVAIICGCIVLGIGLLRLGWLVEFIPAPAVSGFMTGSAINIGAGQLPGLLGITGFNTRAQTFHVIINTLKGLPRTKLDGAFGIPALVFLYTISIGCKHLSKRYPRRSRPIFFISVLRHSFVILILTIAAWLFTRHREDSKGNYPIKILKTVPRGFQHMGVPTIDSKLVKALAPKLPVATIILFLEHISIAKTFGRQNNYKINPNQELIAIGVTNTVGSFFGAYPATGSFSRSALNSKSGVRTPAGGIFSAIVILVALYGLTPAFYWIPTAALSAVIIHAVAGLVTSPAQAYSFWRVSPLEFFIWFAAVLTTVFATIEDGIYVALVASLVLALIRIARPRGVFLGRVFVRARVGDSVEERQVFVPLEDKKSDDPQFNALPPPPGIIIYRHEESYIFPNAHIFDTNLVDYIKENTRQGKDTSNVKAADRPWNNPGPSRKQILSGDFNKQQANLPLLRVVVLDFSAVSQIDTTAVQSLIDARNEIERWADHAVEFHFASILSPWIRRALVAGNFGISRGTNLHGQQVAATLAYDDSPFDLPKDTSKDTESAVAVEEWSDASGNFATIIPTETPFFHVDLTSAVRAAERSNGMSRK